jgi:hypothetical protein
VKTRTRTGGLLAAALLGVGMAVALASPASASTYGPYQLLHVSGYCLEAPSGNLGQQLILNYCGGPASHNQHLTFEDAGDAWLYFLHLEGSPYCLVPGNADLFMSTIVLWTCDRSSTKYMWRLGFTETVDLSKRNLCLVYHSGNNPSWCMDKYNPTAGSYLVMDFQSTNYWKLLTP